MVTELVLTFTDPAGVGSGPLEFTYTLGSPAGSAVTGGQIFLENPQTNDLERFSFRVDHESDGTPSLTIIEDPNS